MQEKNMAPYTTIIKKVVFMPMRKAISIIILTAFISTSVRSPAYARVSAMPFMPKPGVIVHLSPEFTPAHLKGMIIHPENPLKFDFLITRGDENFNDQQRHDTYQKLIKYFLASLAVPDDDQWVNLSPYEKDRIIKDDFGKTEMGRDLLAQDYMLKQITASLIYPGDNLGKKFWDRVYSEAQQQFGTSNIPLKTFNKVWIIPDGAYVYEHGNMVYVVSQHLKVMLEEDYLALQKNTATINHSPSTINKLGSQIVREIVIPALTNEVNTAKNFATLRQVYSGMILAAWYKYTLKESFLGKIYADKGKVKGVDQDPRNNETIYKQYLRAFKKGVFNYIKEDVNKYDQETVPRKYFSGGTVDPGMVGYFEEGIAKKASQAMFAADSKGPIDLVSMLAEERKAVNTILPNPAMRANQPQASAARGTSWDAFQLSLDFNRIIDSFRNLKIRMAKHPSENRALKEREIKKANSALVKIIKRLRVFEKSIVRALAEKLGKIDGQNLFDMSDEQATSIRILFSNLEKGLTRVERANGIKSTPMTAPQSQASAAMTVADLEFDRESPAVKQGPSYLAKLVSGTLDLSGANRTMRPGPDWPNTDEAYTTVLNMFSTMSERSKPQSSVIFSYNDKKVITPSEARGRWNRDRSIELRVFWVSPGYDIYVLIDKAMVLGRSQANSPVQNINGGIDFNAAHLDLRIKRDGQGVPLPMGQQDQALLNHLEGLEPVILEIRPASSLPFFSQLQNQP